jgi:hypothetical protein
MTLGCDMRFVYKDAKIGFVFVRRGIVPEATSTFRELPLIARLWIGLDFIIELTGTWHAPLCLYFYVSSRPS